MTYYEISTNSTNILYNKTTNTFTEFNSPYLNVYRNCKRPIEVQIDMDSMIPMHTPISNKYSCEIKEIYMIINTPVEENAVKEFVKSHEPNMDVRPKIDKTFKILEHMKNTFNYIDPVDTNTKTGTFVLVFIEQNGKITWTLSLFTGHNGTSLNLGDMRGGRTKKRRIKKSKKGGNKLRRKKRKSRKYK